MTEITDYLDHAGDGAEAPIDWTRPPWVVARPALAWLGLAPSDGSAVPPDAVGSEADAKAICDRMVRSFVIDSNELVWSSHMLGTAVEAVAQMVGGPPEPLLQSAWDELGRRDLDENVYEFCRALGAQVRTRHGASARWDLRWMKSSATASQACLRYWILAVKPEIWDAVEDDTMKLLRASPVQF